MKARVAIALAMAAAAGLPAIGQTGVQPSTPGGPIRPNPGQPERPVTPAQPRTPGQPGMTPGRDVGAAASRQPGPQGELKNLEWMVGTWTATVSTAEGPGATPAESRGTMRTEWFIGNRFLQGRFEGETGGRDYEGMSYLGYDQGKGEFDAVWMDSSSSQIMHGTGQWDAGGSRLTINGSYTDPRTGREVTTRTVARKESNDRYTWEMFATPAGEMEFRQLQIVFTRQGSPAGRTPGVHPSPEPFKPEKPEEDKPGDSPLAPFRDHPAPFPDGKPPQPPTPPQPSPPGTGAPPESPGKSPSNPD
jgi:hypothetical protein